jgi:hypothetical protein
MVVAFDSRNLPFSIQSAVSAQDVRSQALSNDEERRLRSIVYTHKLGTLTIELASGVPKRLWNIPDEIDDLFKRKPIATLECLVIIAKGADPQHAVTAIAFGMNAGTSHDVGGAWTPKGFDDIDPDMKESNRQLWVKVLIRRIESER